MEVALVQVIMDRGAGLLPIALTLSNTENAPIFEHKRHTRRPESQ